MQQVIDILGHNQVNETARHEIVAHRLWEENLENIIEVFVNNSFGIVPQFCCPNSLGRISPGKMGQENPYERVRATIPKEWLMKTLVMFSQIFLPQIMSNDPMPYSLVYVIVPLVSLIFVLLCSIHVFSFNVCVQNYRITFKLSSLFVRYRIIEYLC